MSHLSRRGFLATSATVAAGMAVPVPANASGRFVMLPVKAKRPIATYLPDEAEQNELRAIATAGIDIATQLGAQYADIRAAERRVLSMSSSEIGPFSGVRLEAGFGIRVLIDGAWGFAYSAELSADSVARVTRSAIAAARMSAPFASKRDFAPRRPESGTWETPCEVDPFSVSPDEVANTVGAVWQSGERRWDVDVGMRLEWTCDTRGFASSEGAIQTQRLRRSDTFLMLSAAHDIRTRLDWYVPGVKPAAAGLEAIRGMALQEHIRAMADEAARLVRVPEVPVEVGRYAAVFDGAVAGKMTSVTLGSALRLSRALGHEINEAGGSFLTPPQALLETPICGQPITLSVDRRLPRVGAARWDDEGVPTEPAVLIQRGVLKEFLATRDTVSNLSRSSHSSPLHGTAMSWTPALAPTAYATQLTMEPSAATRTMKDQLKQLGNGLFVGGYCRASVDANLSNTFLLSTTVFRVKNGEIVGRHVAGIQMATKKFWQSVTNVGDATTVMELNHFDHMGTQATEVNQAVSSPSLEVSQVDLVNARRA